LTLPLHFEDIKEGSEFVKRKEKRLKEIGDELAK
jgi:hypothetical protein